MKWTDIVDLSEILMNLGRHPTQSPAELDGILPLAPGRVLETLYQTAPQGLMVKELAQILHLTPGSISQAVQILVTDGLVVREVSTKDRRAVSIRITEQGIARVDFHSGKINALLDQLLASVSAEERQTFERVLAVALSEGKKLREAQYNQERRA